MLWFVYAIVVALFMALRDVLQKKGLRHIDQYVLAWAFRFLSVVFMLPVLFFEGIPEIGPDFWVVLGFASVLLALTTIMYLRAIKDSDLSVSIPMLTFSPLFLLLTSPIIVGEFPDLSGLLGVLFIVFGSYILHIKEYRRGFLSPFKALLHDKGPRLMLIIAFIWSFGAVLDKVGLMNSAPVFWAVCVNLVSSILLLPAMLIKSGNKLKQIVTESKILIPIGLITAIGLVFQMFAIKIALVAYVISVKRTSVIFSVLFGFLFFREKGIAERLTGAIIMVIGVILIVL